MYLQKQVIFLPINPTVGAVLPMEQVGKQQEVGVQVKAAAQFEMVYHTGSCLN